MSKVINNKGDLHFYPGLSDVRIERALALSRLIDYFGNVFCLFSINIYLMSSKIFCK